MSGGCYNYLCCKSSLEDIVTEEEYLEQVIKDLIKYDYKDISNDVNNLLQDIKETRVRIEEQLERLNQVFKAVEWYESGDYGESNLKEILEQYRSSKL